MRRFFGVVFAVALWACGGPTEGPLHVRFVGSAEGRVLAQEAADEWTGACGHVVVELADDGCPLEEVASIDPTRPGVTGLTSQHDDSPQWIHVEPGYSFDIRRENMAHEMGHALGFHHYEREGIMNANTDPKAVARFEDCDADLIRFTGQ